MGARGLVFVDSETSHTRKEARTVEYLWLATIEIPLYVTVNISELRTPLERRPRDLSNGVVFCLRASQCTLRTMTLIF